AGLLGNLELTVILNPALLVRQQHRRRSVGVVGGRELCGYVRHFAIPRSSRRRSSTMDLDSPPRLATSAALAAAFFAISVRMRSSRSMLTLSALARSLIAPARNMMSLVLIAASSSPALASC